MKTTRFTLIGSLSSVVLTVAACSSNVDLAAQREHNGVGGASGSTASSSSGGDSTTGAGGAATIVVADAGAPAPGPSFCDVSVCSVVDLRAIPGDPPGLSAGDEKIDCYGFHLSDPIHTHATAIAPLIDNAVTLLDMQLVKTAPGPLGEWPQGCYTAPTGTAVWSWEPGLGAIDASFDLSPGDFVLRVHHVNVTDHAQTDRSGARLCACAP